MFLLLLACGSEVVERFALDCDAAVDMLDAPPATHVVHEEAVALEPGPLDVVALSTGSYWSKTGLLTRDGVETRIVVPSDARDDVTIEWGDAPPSWEIAVPSCEGSGWRAFPGGYSLEEPGCIALEVHREQLMERVSVGVGAPCP